MKTRPKIRLDQLLVKKGIAPTRSKAQKMVESGLISASCGGQLTKPSQQVPDDIELVISPEKQYVSRAAYKLLHAIEHFKIEVKGKICMDLGASTGGFCEVLHEAGAAKIYAVDVGHSQLDPKIAPLVINLENTNCKDLNQTIIPDAIDLITCDVSFISLTKALPAALQLAVSSKQQAAGKKQLTAYCSLLALIKPQFEVGKENIGKGVVHDEKLHQKVIADISLFLQNEGWKVHGITESPILGQKGNKEFLVYATFQPQLQME
jgi:23S rRNA (cytidine1920-2'-O)/16S rRNA (cytidine1409-2'-O)-methyltransferase